MHDSAFKTATPNSLPPGFIQDILYYGDIITVEEDRNTEFKAVQFTSKLSETILKICKEYINAFLNTTGGRIFFGVEDDGKIKGVEINRKDRDFLRLGLDSAIDRFRPQVDPQLYHMDFLPVLYHDARMLAFLDDICLARNEDLFVVRIVVRRGPAPVYFTHRDRFSAFLRRDGGLKRMEPSLIEERLLKAERLHTQKTMSSFAISDSRPKSDHFGSPSQPEFDFRDSSFVGRKQEIEDIRVFVGTNPTKCRVVCISGGLCVGKTSLAQNLFYKFKGSGIGFVLDLQGVNQPKLSSVEGMRLILLSAGRSLSELSNCSDQIIASLYTSLFNQRPNFSDPFPSDDDALVFRTPPSSPSQQSFQSLAPSTFHASSSLLSDNPTPQKVPPAPDPPKRPSNYPSPKATVFSTPPSDLVHLSNIRQSITIPPFPITSGLLGTSPLHSSISSTPTRYSQTLDQERNRQDNDKFQVETPEFHTPKSIPMSPSQQGCAVVLPLSNQFNGSGLLSVSPSSAFTRTMSTSVQSNHGHFGEASSLLTQDTSFQRSSTRAPSVSSQQNGSSPIVLLLENASTYEQISPLIPILSNTIVLITSHRHIQFPTLASPLALLQLKLAPLRRDDSIALINSILGPTGVSTQSAFISNHDADCLAQACGDLPYCIHTACNLLKTRPTLTPVHLITQLLPYSKEPLSISSFRTMMFSNPGQTGIKPARLADLAHLAPCKGTFSAQAIKRLLDFPFKGKTDETIEERLSYLVQHAYVTFETVTGRFYLNSMVRCYCLREAECAGILDEVMNNFFVYYMNYLQSIDNGEYKLVENEEKRHEKEMWRNVDAAFRIGDGSNLQNIEQRKTEEIEEAKQIKQELKKAKEKKDEELYFSVPGKRKDRQNDLVLADLHNFDEVTVRLEKGSYHRLRVMSSLLDPFSHLLFPSTLQRISLFLPPKEKKKNKSHTEPENQNPLMSPPPVPTQLLMKMKERKEEKEKFAQQTTHGRHKRRHNPNLSQHEPSSDASSKDDDSEDEHHLIPVPDSKNLSLDFHDNAPTNSRYRLSPVEDNLRSQPLPPNEKVAVSVGGRFTRQLSTLILENDINGEDSGPFGRLDDKHVQGLDVPPSKGAESPCDDFSQDISDGQPHRLSVKENVSRRLKQIKEYKALRRQKMKEQKEQQARAREEAIRSICRTIFNQYEQEVIPTLEEQLKVEPLIEIKLEGRSKELFHKRVTDMQLIALLQVLEPVQTLQTLNLGYNRLGEESAQALASFIETHHSLHHLNLEYNRYDTQSVKLLNVCLMADEHLLSLNIQGNKIENEGGMQFAEMLQLNDHLESINVSDCELQTESVIALSTALLTNKSLKEISLSNPRVESLQGETIIHFSSMLLSNSTLEAIDLSKNRVRDSHLESLCDALKRNQSMKKLSLRGNELAVQGGGMIGRLLQQNSLITYLDLSANHIGDKGCAKLAEGILATNTLSYLNLQYNGITPPGVIALASALEKNTSIESFFLWGNRFNPASAAALSDAFEAMTQLSDCDLFIWTDGDGVVQVAQFK
ncbi:putative NLR Family CARD Domain Containing protein [Blattamonas nauphoetae]|uniref:NLR Family CARD Domain Containing protein n=1 Tax=Blattamonas nauphoetae TaxID=2049346 RepID=A0ABQ9XTE7_9EUKA|nr:putative NLR Family CARD Domain Containing protein [Blattamonas nauphoetae]